MTIADDLRTVVAVKEPGQYRMHCPSCRPTRKNQSEETLSVSVEGNSFLYQCWHCGETGKSWIFKDRDPAPKQTASQPAMKIDDLVPLTQEAIDFLKGRGLGTHGDNMSCERFFPQVGKITPAIAHLSRNEKGQVVSAKFRSLAGKFFVSQGTQTRFWNLENVKPEGKSLVITEGEFDCMAVLATGTPAISVPSGASASTANQRLSYVQSGSVLFDNAARVILFTDQDEPGRALAEELARRIGKHRCYFVMVPPDCKDANDVLLKHGREALSEAIANAKPWPVAGLYDAVHYTSKVYDLYEKGQGSGIPTGMSNVDGIYTVAPGMVTVVTGVPSSGKSEFVDQLMVNLARRSGWNFCVASFENPPERHIVKLAEKYRGEPFFSGHLPRMTSAGLQEAMSWVNTHFSFIEAADGLPSTIDSIIERAKAAVMRKGVRGLVIDPYNFIERPNSAVISETEQVSDMLTKVKRFANAHEVHVWFIAHPAKMYRQADGTIPVPTGYDILGSSHWFNKADFGLTVHRYHDQGLTMVRCWKARFKWIAQNGDAYLLYDIPTGRYRDAEERQISGDISGSSDDDPFHVPATERKSVRRHEEEKADRIHRYWND